jgi:ribokinase
VSAASRLPTGAPGGGGVLVVGSSMVDLVAYVDRMPADGETVVGDRFVVGMAGKGANQAVMAARLGAPVAFVGCVGDDPYGTAICDNLAAEGIDVGAVTVVRDSSGVAPIWVDRTGANRIVVVPGANDALTVRAATSAVGGSPPVAVVIGQLEVPQAPTAAAFAAARARGATTVLNPAPARPVDHELVALSDWLVPNETEFTLLAARQGLPGADPLDDGAAAELAAAVGTGLVVTRGERGAVVCAAGGQPVRVGAPAVDVVDTTGAGDAFVGAFAVGLARALPAVEAARLGCACASASVGRHGTQASYPQAGEIERLLPPPP